MLPLSLTLLCAAPVLRVDSPLPVELQRVDVTGHYRGSGADFPIYRYRHICHSPCAVSVERAKAEFVVAGDGIVESKRFTLREQASVLEVRPGRTWVHRTGLGMLLAAAVSGLGAATGLVADLAGPGHRVGVFTISAASLYVVLLVAGGLIFEKSETLVTAR